MSSYSFDLVHREVQAASHLHAHRVRRFFVGDQLNETIDAPVVLKRITDLTLSFFGLVGLLPFLFALAIIVRLQSPGPVLYRSLRVGKRGRLFVCYKFRTMIIGADDKKESLRAHNERVGASFKIADDPRITRIGKILRRYSFDELPQLWNVFRGEMSLVGPRPHPLDDVQRYEAGDDRRLEVTPGLTGLWQVTARKDPSFRRNIALDLEYIERHSFWMDLAILYKTIFAVLEGTGA